VTEYVARHDPEAVTEAMNRVCEAIDTYPESESFPMKAIKIQVPDKMLRKLPKSQAERKEVVRLGLQRFTARRRKKAHSVVENTFGAVTVRKHPRIEHLIDQTKYGD
jgi:hypothetical protein